MGPHLTHGGGGGTKSADTLAQEIAEKNDGVQPDSLTLLQTSKSKPPPKGSEPDARGPIIPEWAPIGMTLKSAGLRHMGPTVSLGPRNMSRACGSSRIKRGTLCLVETYLPTPLGSSL